MLLLILNKYFYLYGSFSSCLSYFKLDNSLQQDQFLMLGDKLSPGTKPGFLKSEKMLGLQLLYIHKSVLENVYVNNVINYG